MVSAMYMYIRIHVSLSDILNGQAHFKQRLLAPLFWGNLICSDC